MKRYGNKADNLYIVKELGLDVPDFLVCSFSASKDINAEIDEAVFDLSGLNHDKRYAVRSSAPDEDGASKSQAGRYKTFLNVSYTDVPNKIRACLTSQTRDIHGEVSANVIVQEMIDADLSGIAFGVNPVTGNDKQIVIESYKGLGDAAVGCNFATDRVTIDWAEPGEYTALQNCIVSAVLKIQSHFGYPVDIEFAVAAEKLYILQARPITRIFPGMLTEHFTNANFRDGGVSSASCKGLMRSLYILTYNSAMKDFFIATKSFKKSELTDQIREFCGRLYWNVTACKTANLKLPGFKERDYDEELGLIPDYEGDGLTSRVTLPFLIALPKIAITCAAIFKKNERVFETKYAALMSIYQKYQRLDFDKMSFEELSRTFTDLVTKDYYRAEREYFTQVFINIVRLSLLRKRILKKYGKKVYLDAVSDIGNISHTKTYEALKAAARKISADGKNKILFAASPAGKLSGRYKNNDLTGGLEYIKEFMDSYGYHSNREVDISYPNYEEQPEIIIGQVQKLLSQTPAEVKMPEPKSLPEKLKKNSLTIKKLLWQREELKDISTRYYSLIRKASLALGNLLYKRNIITEPGDIFHAGYDRIISFLHHHSDAKDLQAEIKHNKTYYLSFLNYTPPDDIGKGFAAKKHDRRPALASRKLQGVGCGGGTVTAPARVLADISGIAEIVPGEILVAKYFDVGWISSFRVLSGTVTETGGILCHSSIVSREYGLPAIVSATGAADLIKTGDILQINGFTGEITILKKYKTE